MVPSGPHRPTLSHLQATWHSLQERSCCMSLLLIADSSGWHYKGHCLHLSVHRQSHTPQMLDRFSSHLETSLASTVEGGFSSNKFSEKIETPPYPSPPHLFSALMSLQWAIPFHACSHLSFYSLYGCLLLLFQASRYG